jgi:hypothetical protein
MCARTGSGSEAMAGGRVGRWREFSRRWGLLCGSEQRTSSSPVRKIKMSPGGCEMWICNAETTHASK